MRIRRGRGFMLRWIQRWARFYISEQPGLPVRADR